MKKLQKTTAWMGFCLVVAGCQTPGMTRPRGFGASENSGAFAAGASSDSGGSDSGSDSGGSSDGSGDSSNDSGNSSDGSVDSSNNSANSSDDSKSDSNQSSEESSKNSTDNSSDNSSDSSDSSESSQKNPAASATVVGLTAAGLGVIFWQVAQQAMRPPPPGAAPPASPPPSPQEVSRAAQTYLRSRTNQLREDLALGAGPTVEELAAMARIRREHLGVFGRLLRAHRQELLALADVRALTSARALEWMRRVGEIARTDPRLEEDRRAFLAAYEGSETSP